MDLISLLIAVTAILAVSQAARALIATVSRLIAIAVVVRWLRLPVGNIWSSAIRVSHA